MNLLTRPSGSGAAGDDVIWRCWLELLDLAGSHEHAPLAWPSPSSRRNSPRGKARRALGLAWLFQPIASAFTTKPSQYTPSRLALKTASTYPGGDGQCLVNFACPISTIRSARRPSLDLFRKLRPEALSPLSRDFFDNDACILLTRETMPPRRCVQLCLAPSLSSAAVLFPPLTPHSAPGARGVHYKTHF